MEKFLALFDIHIGWQKTYDVRTAKYKTSPTHDEKFLEKIIKFKQDFKPNILILGGDQKDFGTFSKYNQGEVVQRSEGLIQQVYKECDRWIYSPLSCPEVYEIEGNHDWRLEKYLRKNPELTGLLHISDVIPRLKHEVTFINSGEYLQLGKLYVVHGDNIRGKSCNAAATAMRMYSKNIRSGHHHTYNAVTMYSAIDEEIKTSISVPCCCRRDMEWMNKTPNTWVQGFLYGYLRRDGTFQDYVVIRARDKFIANGKEY